MRPFPNFTPSNANASGTIDTKGVNKNEQLVIYNDTVFSIKLTFPDTNVDIIPPSWGKDWILPNQPMGIVKWEVVNQIQGTNYPITQVYGTLYEPTEHVARLNTSMSRSPAVTPVASGDPIFSATVGFGSTVSQHQRLNVFNPANSGMIYTFHSARVFTSSAIAGNRATLSTAPSPDYNLANAVPAISHDGSANPRISSAHCTSQDSNASIGAQVSSDVEQLNTQSNVTGDILDFPDSVTLFPGNNLVLLMTEASGTTDVVRLTMK